MTLPEISFKVVASDVDAFNQKMRGVGETCKKTNVAILQSREKLSQDIRELEEDDANKVISTADKILRIKQRQQLEERHLLMSDIAQKKALQEEHFNWTKKLAQRYTALQVGSMIGGLGNSQIGRHIGRIGGAVGGMPGALLGGGLGLAAGAAAHVMTEMFQGTMQLGGARSLSEMITETGENEKIFQVARQKVTPDQRVSMLQMRERASQLSENAELGSFKAGEWGKTFDVLGARTGSQAEYFSNPDVFKTIGMLSHLGGVGPEAMAESFSQMRGQLHGNTDAALDALRASFAIGQKGNFGPEALAASQKAVANVSGLGGDRLQNLESIFGIQSIMMEHGWAAQKGGTAIERFSSMVAKKPNDFKGMGAKFDANGQLTNFNEVLSKWASTPIDKLFANKDISTGPMKELHDALQDEAATRHMTVQQLLEDADKQHLSMADLEKMNKEGVTTAERLKAAFNQIADKVGPVLLQSLTDNMPQITDLLSTFANQLPGFIEDISKLGGAALYIASHIPGYDPNATQSGDFQNWVKDLSSDGKGRNKGFDVPLEDGENIYGRQAAVYALQNPHMMEKLTDLLHHTPSQHEATKLLSGLITGVALDDYTNNPAAGFDKAIQKAQLEVLDKLLLEYMKANGQSVPSVATPPTHPARAASATPVIQAPNRSHWNKF